MNHLRELLDVLPLNINVHPAFFDIQHTFHALKWARDVAENAICFSIGSIKDVLELSVIPELCRLPYEYCWFEAEFDCLDQPGRVVPIGMLCSQKGREFIGVLFGRTTSGKWALDGVITGDSLTDPQMRLMAEEDDEVRGCVRALTRGVCAFLSALHCSNVSRQEHKPDAKLQKARAKRGKAPIFSYWTLQLQPEGKSQRGDHAGGTHSSPRVHLRRGHPRRYAPGKWTWVQPHAVGNRAAGVVHKDYSAAKPPQGHGCIGSNVFTLNRLHTSTESG